MHSKSPRAAIFLVVVGAVAACTGCGDKKPEGGSPGRAVPEPPPVQSRLVGSESVIGLRALHDTAHARARRGDTLGLLRLFARDSIYRAVVWPTQPSYEPDREEVWNLVIGMNKANSSKGLRRLLADAPHATADAAPLPDFSVKEIPGGAVYAASKGDRKPGELRVFTAALCLHGACQVLTYANGGLVGGSGGPGGLNTADSGEP